MEGVVSLTLENNIAVEYGEFYVELWGLARLTDVFGIANWDHDGYFAFDTNYGEEYYEVGEYLKDIFTTDEIEEIGFLREFAKVKTVVMKQEPEKNGI